MARSLLELSRIGISEYEHWSLLAKYYKNSEVLVTGGAGFIGSHIVSILVKLGAQVTILDDFSTGSLANIQAIQHAITIITGSVTNFQTCLEAARDKQYIFHLAAIVSVPESFNNPVACNAVNITGTLNMLEAARVHAVPSFTFTSSSSIYGNQERICQEDVAANPTSPYGFSKHLGELSCRYYSTHQGLKTVVLRYFNVFTHGNNSQLGNGVIAQFKKQMALNEPILIFGNGKQRRDFISVGAVAQATLLLSLLPSEHISGQSVNIATGTSATILDVFNQLRLEFPFYDKGPLYQPARPGDVYVSLADCTKYRNLVELCKLIL